MEEPITPRSEQILPSDRPCSSHAASRSSSPISSPNSAIADDINPAIQESQCRICREEDVTTNLDIPCACRGTLTYSHIPCLQRWINQKKNQVCEICGQPYNSNYTASATNSADETAIDIRGDNLQPPAIIEAPQRLHERDSVVEGCCLIICVSLSLFFTLLALLYLLPVTGGGREPNDSIYHVILKFVIYAVPCCAVVLVLCAIMWKSKDDEALPQREPPRVV